MAPAQSARFLAAKHDREFPAFGARLGDGHHAQRALLFSVAIEFLRRHGTNLDAVAGILARAKAERMREVLHVEQYHSQTKTRLAKWEQRRVFIVRHLERYQAFYRAHRAVLCVVMISTTTCPHCGGPRSDAVARAGNGAPARTASPPRVEEGADAADRATEVRSGAQAKLPGLR